MPEKEQDGEVRIDFSVLCDKTYSFFRLRIIHAEGIDSHSLHDLRFHGTIAEIGACGGDLVYHIKSLDDLSKSRVSAVQMGTGLMHDEELGACGVRMHGSGHGQDARCVSQIVLDAVLGELSLDGVARSAGSGALGAAALNHEAVDNAVEIQSVIETLLHEADENC